MPRVLAFLRDAGRSASFDATKDPTTAEPPKGQPGGWHWAGPASLYRKLFTDSTSTNKEAVMAEVKIKPGSLTIEIVDDKGKVVDTLDYPLLSLTKVRLEPKHPKYGPARDIWQAPEPAIR